MLSNSQVLFSDLSHALYRAGLFVSYADVAGGTKAHDAEVQALNVLMKLLQEQNSEASFLHDLGRLASGDVRGIEHLSDMPKQNLDNLQADLGSVPSEVESAMRLVLNNFPKSDARLYSDMVISAAASVAQAYDERDEFFLTGDRVVDSVTFLTNMRPLFHRFLMFFSDVHADDNAKYLYESNDMFDQLKISSKENYALGQLTTALRSAWDEKYPEDLEQTVQDYIRENDQTN